MYPKGLGATGEFSYFPLLWSFGAGIRNNVCSERVMDFVCYDTDTQLLACMIIETGAWITDSLPFLASKGTVFLILMCTCSLDEIEEDR